MPQHDEALAPTTPSLRPTVSVIVCAYTERRWPDLISAVASLEAQRVRPTEVLVVIDHNEILLAAARQQFPKANVLANEGPRGLSGARNTGIAHTTGDIVAFIDDDAIAPPAWLAELLTGYADPEIVGVGGPVEPMWPDGRPSWFPPEFDWVVGCTFQGMPETTTRVPKLIGCNMSFRREAFHVAGAFRADLGRVGTRPLASEETELSLRLGQMWPEKALLYIPAARVLHRVTETRTRWAYFRERSFAEGLSKAAVTRLVGARDGLQTERAYTMRTLPQAVAQGLGEAVRGDVTGLARAGTVVAGLAFTAAGYIYGSATLRQAEPPVPVTKTAPA